MDERVIFNSYLLFKGFNMTANCVFMVILKLDTLACQEMLQILNPGLFPKSHVCQCWDRLKSGARNWASWRHCCTTPKLGPLTSGREIQSLTLGGGTKQVLICKTLSNKPGIYCLILGIIETLKVTVLTGGNLVLEACRQSM